VTEVIGTAALVWGPVGRALISGRWNGWWIYWAGPLIGTIAPILVFSSIARRIEVAKLHHFESDRRRLFHVTSA
jgi:aquaporin Z